MNGKLQNTCDLFIGLMNDEHDSFIEAHLYKNVFIYEIFESTNDSDDDNSIYRIVSTAKKKYHVIDFLYRDEILIETDLLSKLFDEYIVNNKNISFEPDKRDLEKEYYFIAFLLTKPDFMSDYNYNALKVLLLNQVIGIEEDMCDDNSILLITTESHDSEFSLRIEDLGDEWLEAVETEIFDQQSEVKRDIKEIIDYHRESEYDEDDED